MMLDDKGCFTILGILAAVGFIIGLMCTVFFGATPWACAIGAVVAPVGAVVLFFLVFFLGSLVDGT